MNKLTTILTGVIVCLLILLWTSTVLYHNAKNTRDRLADNMETITLKNAVLTLTLAEYDRIQTEDKAKLDSVLKANQIKPKTVKAATVINTVYRDTGSVKVVYRDVEKLPDSSYQIPVEVETNCWGMKGQILTVDPKARLKVTERTNENSVQLIVTRKKFLGFLWWRKGQTFKAYTDCGEVNFTQINFVKN